MKSAQLSLPPLLKTIKIAAVLVVGFWTFAFVFSAFAQTDPMTTDIRPFAPLEGGGLDAVSAANGSLSVHIPIWSIKQRGNLTLSATAVYSSGGFTKIHQCLIPQDPCTDTYDPRGLTGVRIAFSTDVSMQVVPATVENSSTNPPTFFTEGYYWQVVTPDGGTHKLANTGNGIYRSEDGTGWQFNETSYVLISRDGVRYVFSGTPGTAQPYPTINYLSYVEDANGNRITLTWQTSTADGVTTYSQTGWVDTFGRTIGRPVATTDFSGCTGPGAIVSAITWTVPDSSVSFKFCNANVQFNTDFFDGSPLSQPGPNQTEFEYQGTKTFLQSIVLPDGESWQFQYTPLDGSQYNYGELSQMVLPTGGTIGYGWNENYQICPNTQNQNNYNDIVGHRYVSAGGGAPTASWTYGAPYSGASPPTGSYSSSTVDPLGNTIVHILTPLSGSCSLYETETDFYDSQNNKLRTDTTTYESQADINRITIGTNTQTATAMGVFPVQTTSTWANGATKKTTLQYDPGFQITNYDGSMSATIPYGLVTGKTEYDYGNGSAGAVLRTTTTNYKALQDASYMADNLLDLPVSVTVTDGPTGQQSITTYGYDESALADGNASGAGWDSNPPSGSIRGNQTSINRYWDTTSSYLKTSKTYTNTGLLASITEPSNSAISPASTTTYSYDATYDGAYPTTETDALGHTVQHAYNVSSGMPTSVTDQNGVATTYTYDSMKRLTGISIPGGSQNLVTSISYSYPDANTVTKTELLNSSTQPESDTTTYDGLGREVKTDHLDPEGDVYTDTTFDLLGRKNTESTPYRSTSDTSSYGITTYSYDGLGRVTQIQRPDGAIVTYQYAGATTLSENEGNGTSRTEKLTKVDGLGRLVAVCEITSATLSDGGSTPANCGLEIPGTGFLTTYTQNIRGITKITQGVQTRNFAYDSLGQLTSTQNPETGTITYSYDTDGNVVSKTMAAPDNAPGSLTINYSYDALHRLTQKTYSGPGSVVNISPSSYYSYDQATVDGKTLERPIGRLTSEYTSLNGTIQAKSLYSYDTTGRVENHYQCVLTACSGSYQDVQYDYDGGGNMTSLSTSQNDTQYFYDEAGHLTAVSPTWTPDSTHPATFLTSAQYAPDGAWAVANFGNNTSETYTYTPRWLTGMQMKGYDPNSLPHATGSVSIDGTEKSQTTTTPGVAGSGTLSVSGSEGSYVHYSPPGCIPSGSMSTDTSQGAVSPQFLPGPCTSKITVYDTGTITITVDGHSDTINWGSTSSDSNAMAVSIANAINGDASALVTATPSGSTVTLVAKTTGTATDYPVSVTVTDTNSTWTSSGYSPSFSVTPLSMQLAGGANGTSNTVYDSGTISVTVDGSTKTVSYGRSSTSTSIASALVNAINGDGSYPVTAGSPVSGGGSTEIVPLTSKDGGSIGNWPLSVSSTYDTGHFSSGSFPVSASGGSLTGGQDDTGGQTTIYSFSLSHAPDGQITSSSDSVNGNWSYTYDDFNRLNTATETDSGGATISGLSWDYDRYGNRWHQNVTAGTGTSTSLTFDTASNHASTGLGYDLAGNVLNDTNHAYVYDAENRISQVDGGVSYIYDAEGRRVGKSNGTVYVVGLSGNVIDEIDSGAWVRSEVYAGSRHLATVMRSGVYFTHSDWLGTERARTSPTGVMCEYTVSEPFGDGAQSVTPAGTPGCNPTPTFFTGKQRDTESNLDDFGARYLSSQWGRWMSPDWSAAPAAVPYATLGNPQSLNLYAYVGSDPVNGEDPDGHSMMRFGDQLDNAFGLEAANQSEMSKENQTPASAGESEKQPLSSVNVLGRKIAIGYAKGLSITDELAASDKIASAASLINDNAKSLTAAEKKAIGQISSFSVVGPGTALGATGKGSMTLSVGYMKASPAEWVGSLFGHEGQHYLNTGKYTGSNLWRDEQSASKMQLEIGKKIGFNSNEIRQLNGWMDDKNRMQQHMQQGYSY